MLPRKRTPTKSSRQRSVGDPKVREMIAAMTDLHVANPETTLGVSEGAVKKVKQAMLEAPADSPDDQNIRAKYREQFIEKGYLFAFKLLQHAAQPEKIAQASFADLMKGVGIIMDKVIIAQSRVEEVEAAGHGYGFMPDDTLALFIKNTEQAILATRKVGRIPDRVIQRTGRVDFSIEATTSDEDDGANGKVIVDPSDVSIETDPPIIERE